MINIRLHVVLLGIILVSIIFFGCVSPGPQPSEEDKIGKDTTSPKVNDTLPETNKTNKIKTNKSDERLPPMPPIDEIPNNETEQNQTIPALSPEWKVAGIAVAGKYADADVVYLDNGKYRLYFAAEPEVQGFEGQVYSATSTDGMIWTKEDGTRRTWSTFPSVIKLSNGKYRMYYQNAEIIKSATSSDGLSWEEESGTRIDKTNSAGLNLENVAAPTVMEVKGEDYTYLMVYRGNINTKYSPPVPNSDTQLFLWATSKDGLVFEKKGIALDSRNAAFEGLLDGPELVQWDDGTMRLYFWSYAGIFHTEFKDNTFAQDAVFDFTVNTNPNAPYSPDPPCDPTLIKIDDKWFMYYGQHTKGVYYATLED